MADFRRHIGPLVIKEGGYRLVDHPADNGGRTYAGISERWHPNWDGWRMLSSGASPSAIEDAVRRFYRQEFWDPIRGDEITHDDVAEVLLSSAVLSGVHKAVAMAQMVSGAAVDGKMGPQTLAAINRMNPDLFEATFAVARMARYWQICMSNPSQDVFLKGWIGRVLREMEE